MCAHDVTDENQNEETPGLEKWKSESKAAIYTALSHIQEGCCSDGIQDLFLLLVYFLAQLYSSNPIADDSGVWHLCVSVLHC